MFSNNIVTKRLDKREKSTSLKKIYAGYVLFLKFLQKKLFTLVPLDYKHIKNTILTLSACLLLTCTLNAQQTLFYNQLKKLPTDLHADFIKEQFSEFYKKDSAKAYFELKKCTQEFKNNPKLTGVFHLCYTHIYLKNKNYTAALQEVNLATKIFDSLALYELSSESLSHMFNIHHAMGERKEIMAILFNRLKQISEIPEMELIVLIKIAHLFKELQNEDKAITYFIQAEKASEKVSLSGKYILKAVLSINKNLGVLYRNKKEFGKAEFYFNKGLALAEEHDDTYYKGIVLNSLGILYRQKGDLKKAINVFEESLKIKMDQEDKVPVATTYANLGGLYLSLKDFKKAEDYFLKGEKLLLNSKDIKRKLQTYEGLANLYHAINQQTKAYPYLFIVSKLKDSIYSSNLSEENAKLEAIYSSEKKQKEIELSNLKNKQLEEGIRLKNRENNIFLAGTSALILLLILVIRSYLAKRKTNNELENKNELIVMQKIKVEEQHKEIIDSITYAKRLQEGILPSAQFISSKFKEHFVLYKPKDIVAGDFYWMEIKEDTILLAVADCTGHGVPGALVSMVCSNALNRSVHEFNLIAPGLILDKTRELVLESFEKGGMDVKDGMDISLIAINNKKKEILWAGANNPVWYYINNKLCEIKADKQPIGKSYQYQKFNSHQIPYNVGMSIYLFSDGYADQFGGLRGKKLMNKRFAEYITQVNALPMAEQGNLLTQYFADWQGSLSQLDDVCVIGIKLSDV